MGTEPIFFRIDRYRLHRGHFGWNLLEVFDVLNLLQALILAVELLNKFAVKLIHALWILEHRLERHLDSTQREKCDISFLRCQVLHNLGVNLFVEL